MAEKFTPDLTGIIHYGPNDKLDVDFDALPQHKRESFMIAQLEIIQRWLKSQEAEKEQKA